MLRAFVLSLFFILGARAECPDSRNLDVMTEDGTAFWCMWHWDDWGDTDPRRGCNGEEFQSLAEEKKDSDWDTGEYYPFGSIIVKPGCTLLGYEDYGYAGPYVEYFQNTFPDGCTIGTQECPSSFSGVWGYHSYQCTCKQVPIICEPTDAYVVIDQFDNASDIPITCTWSKSVGTTFTDTVNESMSIDASIEAEMKAKFFKMFQVEIGISVDTGYDWTHISEEEKETTETVTVEAVVPPHTILKIEGAIGICDDNKVNTKLFKFTTYDGSDGKILSQYFDTST